jgi:RimJ/RimL family protein N-acetyltransferase
MRTAPPLLTERLILRSLTLEDAADVQRLAGERDIASMLPNMPHPYEDGMAEEWMHFCSERYDKDEALNFAITLRTDKHFIGGIGLKLDRENERGEIGYWVGKPYWNHGYMTEAVKAVVAYSFKVLKMNRIHAKYFTRNVASKRVMEKIGMRYANFFPQDIENGYLEDTVEYSILKCEFIER